MPTEATIRPPSLALSSPLRCGSFKRMKRFPSLNSFHRLICRPLLAGLGLVLLSFPPAEAGEWQVIPIRLEFDQTSRSGVLTVTNAGETPLTVNVDAYQWLQDGEGKDLYEKSSELVFFPRSLTIAPGKERVIRTGIKVPSVSAEKTYRLFIEEVPDTRQPDGTGVALAIRFGVPVFSRPVKPEVAGELGPLEISSGVLRIPLRNTGNVHFRISSIQLTGRDAAGAVQLEQELTGWYLLHGAARSYHAELPVEICRNLETLAVRVQGDGVELNGMTHVDKAMCHSAE